MSKTSSSILPDLIICLLRSQNCSTIILSYNAWTLFDYFLDYQKYENSFKLLLRAIVTSIKSKASKNPSDHLLNRTDCEHRLAYISNVFFSNNCAIFECGDVTISILLSRGFAKFKSAIDVYKKASKVKNTNLYQ